jgi:hypothetical protein
VYKDLNESKCIPYPKLKKMFLGVKKWVAEHEQRGILFTEKGKFFTGHLHAP